MTTISSTLGSSMQQQTTSPPASSSFAIAVGIGVTSGVVVLVLLVVVGGGYFIRRRRKQAVDVMSVEPQIAANIAPGMCMLALNVDSLFAKEDEYGVLPHATNDYETGDIAPSREVDDIYEAGNITKQIIDEELQAAV
jgi:hypothetical protein